MDIFQADDEGHPHLNTEKARVALYSGEASTTVGSMTLSASHRDIIHVAALLDIADSLRVLTGVLLSREPSVDDPEDPDQDDRDEDEERVDWDAYPAGTVVRLTRDVAGLSDNTDAPDDRDLGALTGNAGIAEGDRWLGVRWQEPGAPDEVRVWEWQLELAPDAEPVPESSSSDVVTDAPEVAETAFEERDPRDLVEEIDSDFDGPTALDTLKAKKKGKGKK